MYFDNPNLCKCIFQSGSVILQQLLSANGCNIHVGHAKHNGYSLLTGFSL